MVRPCPKCCGSGKMGLFQAWYWTIKLRAFVGVGSDCIYCKGIGMIDIGVD